MAKIRTTITINKDLLKKAKEHSISISSFLDIKLREYLALIEGKQTNYPQFNKQSNENKHHHDVMGPPRFELESLAPKARRIDQATPRALGS